MNALSKLAPVVSIKDGKPVTTTLDIAQHFSKRHDTVLRAVKNLDCSKEFTDRNFAASEYADSTGRKLPMFQITRDGFVFLCMGFTGAEAAKWKEAYINAFNEMEAALRNQPPAPQLTAMITEAQAGELSALVAERFPDGRKRPYAWGRFNNHFRLSGYKNLPASRFEEACEYIRAMPDKDAEKALPPPAKAISDKYSVESWLKYNPWIKPDIEMTTDGKKRFSMTAFMVYSMDTRSATQMLINELTEKGHNVEACRIELNALKVFISNLRFHMQDIANIAQGSLDQTVMVKYSPAS